MDKICSGNRLGSERVNNTTWFRGPLKGLNYKSADFPWFNTQTITKTLL